MSSEGVASAINPSFIILNLTTNITLIKLVPVIVDFIMLYCGMENRLEYKRCKYETSKVIGSEDVDAVANGEETEESEDEDEEDEENDKEKEPLVVNA